MGTFRARPMYELEGTSEECAQEYLRTDELFVTDLHRTEPLRQALAIWSKWILEKEN